MRGYPQLAYGLIVIDNKNREYSFRKIGKLFTYL